MPGSGETPVGELEATSVTLDSKTAVEFEVRGTSPTPGVDYAQLRSTGPVALDSATLGMVVPKIKETCQAPPIGQTYTLVSTPEELTGGFGNAPEDAQIPITYPPECGTPPAEKLQVEYHRSGATKTVTGQVMSAGEAVTVHTPETPASSPTRSVADLVPDEPGHVTLSGTTFKIRARKDVLVKLACAGAGSCVGKLTLSAHETVTKKDGKKSSRTVTIGTATFSLAAGKTASVTVQLNATGRKLLTDAHGRLDAHLQVAEQAPGSTFTKQVHLVEEKSKKG